MHFSDNLQRWRLSLGEREHGRIICPTCARSANIVQADYGGLSSVPVVSCDVCGFITSVDSVANVPKEWYDPVTAELKAYVDIANELLALADDIGDKTLTREANMASEYLDELFEYSRRANSILAAVNAIVDHEDIVDSAVDSVLDKRKADRQRKADVGAYIPIGQKAILGDVDNRLVAMRRQRA